MRPSWDDTWAMIARTIALRSRCVRAQCGAVIVDASNRIVSTGYNGPPANSVFTDGMCDSFCPRGMHGPTLETMKSYEDCPSIHAEANALMFTDRRLSEGGTLYVTGWPCISCAKLVANSGLVRVVVLTEKVDRTYREPSKTLTLLRQSGLEVATR